jgi:excisionase family DNA binding protein
MQISENPKSIDVARSITTAQAARMLGVSTSTVQKMVDQERVKAWKTLGGHRRIDLASFRAAFRGSPQVSQPVRTLKPCLPVVKIMVDDALTSSALVSELMRWSKFFDISFWSSMPEALLSFNNQMPDVLIVQMSAPLPMQLLTLTELGKFLTQARKPFFVMCMSDNSELSACFPEGSTSAIQILTQDLMPIWLKAFLTGLHAASQASDAHAKTSFN